MSDYYSWFLRDTDNIVNTWNNQTGDVSTNIVTKWNGQMGDVSTNIVTKWNGQTGDVSYNQAQADWAQTNTGSTDYIKNKPSIPSGQIQTDWLQTNQNSIDYIKNKPQHLSRWASNANGIHYSEGYVGIGTTNPTYPFQINQNNSIQNTNIDLWNIVEYPPPATAASSWITYVYDDGKLEYATTINSTGCRLGEYGTGTYRTWATDGSNTTKLFNKECGYDTTKNYVANTTWSDDQFRDDFYIVLSCPQAFVPHRFTMNSTYNPMGSPRKFKIYGFTEQYTKGNIPNPTTGTLLFDNDEIIMAAYAVWLDFKYRADHPTGYYFDDDGHMEFGVFQPLQMFVNTTTAFKTYVLKIEKLNCLQMRLYEGGYRGARFFGHNTLEIGEFKAFGSHPTAPTQLNIQTITDLRFVIGEKEWGMKTISDIFYKSGFIGLPKQDLLLLVDCGQYNTHLNCYGTSTPLNFVSQDADRSIILSKGISSSVNNGTPVSDLPKQVLLPGFNLNMANSGFTMCLYFKVRASGNKDDILLYYGSQYGNPGGTPSWDGIYYPINTPSGRHNTIDEIANGVQRKPPYPFEISIKSSGLDKKLSFYVKLHNQNIILNESAPAATQTTPGSVNLGYTIEEGINTYQYIPYDSYNSWHVLTVVLDDSKKQMVGYLASEASILTPKTLFEYNYNATLTTVSEFNNNALNQFTTLDSRKTMDWNCKFHALWNKPFNEIELMLLWTYLNKGAWSNASNNTVTIDSKATSSLSRSLPMIDMSGNTPKLNFSGQINELAFNSSSLAPATNKGVSLGTPDKRFSELYVGSNSIDIEGTVISGSNGLLGVNKADPSYNLHIGGGVYADTYYNLPDLSANVILEKLKTVDGSGCGLDADLLDGNDSTYYLDYNNLINKPTKGQSDWNVTDTSSNAFIKNKPTNLSPWDICGNNVIYGGSSNVGIGTIPSYTLDVSGNMNAKQYYKNGKVYSLNPDDLTVELPPGKVMHYLGKKNDALWKNDIFGQTVNRNDYKSLANALGVPTSRTTFTVPYPDGSKLINIQRTNLQGFGDEGKFYVGNGTTGYLSPVNNMIWNSTTGLSVTSTITADRVLGVKYTDISGTPIFTEQVNADWDISDNTSLAYIQNKPSLAPVATSGDYNDLNNTPALAPVATSGDYNDLINKPTLTITSSKYKQISADNFTYSTTSFINVAAFDLLLEAGIKYHIKWQINTIMIPYNGVDIKFNLSYSNLPLFQSFKVFYYDVNGQGIVSSYHNSINGLVLSATGSGAGDTPRNFEVEGIIVPYSNSEITVQFKVNNNIGGNSPYAYIKSGSYMMYTPIGSII